MPLLAVMVQSKGGLERFISSSNFNTTGTSMLCIGVPRDGGATEKMASHSRPKSEEGKRGAPEREIYIHGCSLQSSSLSSL